MGCAEVCDATVIGASCELENDEEIQPCHCQEMPERRDGPGKVGPLVGPRACDGTEREKEQKTQRGDDVHPMQAGQQIQERAVGAAWKIDTPPHQLLPGDDLTCEKDHPEHCAECNERQSQTPGGVLA